MKSAMHLVSEGKAKIFAAKEDKISKKLEVFYNPIMKLNRDISVLLLNSIRKRKLKVGLPLAGSGIRGLRFLKELKRGKLESVSFNDNKQGFVEYMKKNLKINDVKSKVVVGIFNEDANLFLLKSKGFDYIDIDPFGTPNPFLDSAVRRLSRKSIFAVTATDTSALCGTFPKACLRKYWAVPSRDALMHEIGLRILIRKVQLVGAQYDRALTPIFSYSKDHYMRVFFSSAKGKKKVDAVMKQLGHLEDGRFKGGKACPGPMWLGRLWDTRLVKSMLKNTDNASLRKYLEIILAESKIPVVGFFDVHALCEKNRLGIPKKEALIKILRGRGYKASQTIFSPYGIRTNVSEDIFLLFIKGKGKIPKHL